MPGVMTNTRQRRRTGWHGALAVFAGLIVLLAVAATATAKDNKVPLPRPSPSEATDAVVPDTGGAGDNIAGQGAGSGDDLGTDTDTDTDSVDVGNDTTAAPDVGPPADIRPGSYTLEARLTADGPALANGVKWRIFGDQPGSDGSLPVLGQASGGVIYLKLDPGTYYVDAAFGDASASRRIDVTSPTGGQVVVLNAGGMRLLAVNGDDNQLGPGSVNFDISAYDESGSDENVIVHNAPPGHVIALAAGIYHVVCHYGDANAVVRADIRVDAGKLTEATMYQKAARLTLKLVEQHGGEALANTAWSVVTPAGDTVVESVGAFPSVVLAAGNYKAIAKHDGKTYESDFKVEAGIDRDVEVLLR